MKKCILAVLLTLFSLSFVACENDDENEDQITPPDMEDKASVYKPYEGKQVAKVSIYSEKNDNSSEIVFEYNTKGRISKMSKGENVYQFYFDEYSLTVQKDGKTLYQCELNEDGNIISLNKEKATFSYNEKGALNRCDYSPAYFTVGYQSASWGDVQTRLTTYSSESSTGTAQTYLYTEYENKTNIDLHALISNCFAYEAWFGEYGTLAFFDLFGNRSANLMSVEYYNNQHTYTYEYTMDNDLFPLEIIVTDNATLNNVGTYTYNITY